MTTTSMLKITISYGKKLRHGEPIDMKTGNKITCTVAMERKVEETDVEWRNAPGALKRQTKGGRHSCGPTSS